MKEKVWDKEIEPNVENLLPVNPNMTCNQRVSSKNPKKNDRTFTQENSMKAFKN